MAARNSPSFRRGADDSDGFWSNLDEPLELLLIRRTRPRVKIPDYRPPERVEIELDSDR